MAVDEVDALLANEVGGRAFDADRMQGFDGVTRTPEQSPGGGGVTGRERRASYERPRASPRFDTDEVRAVNGWEDAWFIGENKCVDASPAERGDLFGDERMCREIRGWPRRRHEIEHPHAGEMPCKRPAELSFYTGVTLELVFYPNVPPSTWNRHAGPG